MLAKIYPKRLTVLIATKHIDTWWLDIYASKKCLLSCPNYYLDHNKMDFILSKYCPICVDQMIKRRFKSI